MVPNRRTKTDQPHTTVLFIPPTTGTPKASVMAPQVMALSAAAPGKAKKPTQIISLAAGSIAGGTCEGKGCWMGFGMGWEGSGGLFEKCVDRIIV